MANPARTSWERFKAAVAAIDQRSQQILAFHAAIERELDAALAASLPNARLLKGLGFGQKVGLWSALQPLPQERVERMAKPMLQFNELRNAVAHGAPSTKVDSLVEALLKCIPNSRDEDGAGLFFAAGYICGLFDVSVGLRKENVD